MSKVLFSIVVPLPYWESRGKKQIISLNNTGKWARYGITKIKNQYKDLLGEFYLPEPPGDPYKSLDITYEILRHNKRRADSMNLVAYSDKWLLDKLTSMGWLTDDDNCFHHIRPAIYTEGLVETQLRVTVREV